MRPAEVKHNQLCGAHNQQSRAGKLLGPIRRPRGTSSCGFGGCDLPYLASGWCSGHYQQFRANPDRMYPVGTFQRTVKSLLRDSRGRKRCSDCRVWHPESRFSRRARSAGDGLNARCKECVFWADLAANYRLTRDGYFRLYDEQGGSCPMCLTHLDPMHSKTHVDHDHSCCSGKRSCGMCVRGIVCSTCNTGLGMFKDSQAILGRAINYLEGRV